MADRLTKAVALPYDVQIVVTDKIPKGIALGVELWAFSAFESELWVLGQAALAY